MKLAIYDIEGNGLLVPIYDKKTEILTPPCNKIWCMVIQDYQTKEIFKYRPHQMVEGYKKLLEYDMVIGHNSFGYDGPALEKIIGQPNNLPPLKQGDTYIMSRLLWGPMDAPTPTGRHSIEAYGQLFGYPKIEFNDWSQFTEEMLEYCVRDVEIGYKTYEYLAPLMTEDLREAYLCETKFATLMSQQMMTGATLDKEAHDELIQVLEVSLAEARDKLSHIQPPSNRITMKTPEYYIHPENGIHYSKKKDCPAAWRPLLKDGPLRVKVKPFNPDSATQLADYFINVLGYKPTKFTENGNPSFGEEVLEKLPYDDADIILDYRVATKRLSQCTSWLSYLYNGRIHGSINTMGATTYRCTHSNPNMTAVPAARKPFGKECRSVWIPQDGWTLTGTDAKGLELRMLANALYPYDGGKYIDLVLSGEVHNANQKKLELDERDDAKTVIYAFNYSAGLLKLGRICRSSEGLRKAAQKEKLHPKYLDYLAANNWLTDENVLYAKIGKVVKARLFENMHGLDKLLADLSVELQENGWIYGIDRRRIPVDSDHVLLNRRLQSDGGIVMKYSLIEHHDILTKHGLQLGVDYNYILNVHDEFQVEHKPEYTELMQQAGNDSIRIAGEKLNIKCPLEGDSSSGRSWAETH